MAVSEGAMAVNVSVGDNSYELLLRLEAEGLIESGLLATRPIGRKEALRLVLEAERNSKGKGKFIEALIKSLKERFGDEADGVKYVKPLDGAYIKYVYGDESAGLAYNNDGDAYRNGSNLRAGLSSVMDIGWLSYRIEPEYRYSGDGSLIMRRAYGSVRLKGLEFTAGKDSMWWGPGHHGSLLLSNNARPLTFLSLTNPQPTLLPWILKYLGPFRFAVFVTRLEKERAVPEPYMWGLRFDFKPSPYVELGLERTALLGGEGRDESAGAWWRSFIGKGENNGAADPGDQKAGGDIKITLPLKWQPVQLYGSAAGEDEAGGLPSKWAYLIGLYLPRMVSLERVGFRVEYANNHIDGHPYTWYNHWIYHTGYRYRGRVMGHHMGTDSKDLFIGLSYLVPENDALISLYYDREDYNLSRITGVRSGKRQEGVVLVSLKPTGTFTLDASFRYGRLTGTAEDRDFSEFSGAVGYGF